MTPDELYSLRSYYMRCIEKATTSIRELHAAMQEVEWLTRGIPIPELAHRDLYSSVCAVCGACLNSNSDIFNPVGLHWVCAACNTSFEGTLEVWLRSRQASGASVHELR